MDGYQGQKFTREQLVFVAEAILAAAVDRIEGGMPTSDVTWEERLKVVGGDAEAAGRLTSYDQGVLETTGMALAVLYAQLTGDGLGIGDALGEADRFEQAVENWVHTAWRDKGEAVAARIERFHGTTWNIADAYANYPDCRRHAKAFVDNVFDEYLALE
jgi:hypothetical protein